MTIDRLFVIWSDPDRGARHVIGHLQRSAGTFRFWYGEDLGAAEQRGFLRLPAFPDPRDESRPYEARYLFATFAERIPSPARPDAAAMLRSWGVVHADDQFEILARSGGVRATDRLELAEYRAVDDDLDVALEFRIAGAKHAGPIDLHVGERLDLERDRSNEWDKCATLVVARTGQKVGFVPRQYSRIFANLLDAGVPLDAEAVRQLVLPDDAGRWVVRAGKATT